MRRLGKALVAAVAAASAMGVVVPTARAEEAGGVSGWVWFDRDENRSPDLADAPRAGFTVTVHEAAPGVDRAAVTNASDEDGDRELLDVPSGTCRIEAVSPAGTVATRYRVAGSEWCTDSGFVGTTRPVSDPFELRAAGWIAGVDAGFITA